MNFTYSDIFRFVFLFICVFFIYLTFLDYRQINKETNKISKYLKKINGEKCYLEKNVLKFSGPKIDLDLLETQSRNIMASLDSSETVFFWKELAGDNLNVYNG